MTPETSAPAARSERRRSGPAAHPPVAADAAGEPAGAEKTARRGRPGRGWLLGPLLGLIFLVYPVTTVLTAAPAPLRVVLALGGAALFSGVFLWLMWTHQPLAPAAPRAEVLACRAAVALLGVLVVVLTLTLGTPWGVLFFHVNAAAGLILWRRDAYVAIAGLALFTAGLALATGEMWLLWPTAALGLWATSFAGQVAAVAELRAAREDLARLAVAEERLRFARDLHDLLGHSLSLITLKLELAGRLLPGSPERAAVEIREAQTVSRRALREVREVVAGYRQPTLSEALAGAREMLAAAGIVCQIENDAGRLPEAAETLLAWTVREGVTNVIRHSRARRCDVRLAREGGAPRGGRERLGRGPRRRAGAALPRAGSRRRGRRQRTPRSGRARRRRPRGGRRGGTAPRRRVPPARPPAAHLTIGRPPRRTRRGRDVRHAGPVTTGSTARRGAVPHSEPQNHRTTAERCGAGSVMEPMAMTRHSRRRLLRPLAGGLLGSAFARPAPAHAGGEQTERVPTVAAWLGRNAVPLASVEPGAPLDDLGPLGRSVGDAAIVGLGESAHGAAEATALKHRALRLLVERLGFRTVAWEDDWTLGLLLDAYIATGEGNLDALMQQMSTAWRSQEVAAVLRWLRDFNAGRADKVSFFGVEYYATRTLAYDAVEAYVAGSAPQRLAELREHLRAVRPDTSDMGRYVRWFFNDVADKAPYVDHARRAYALVEGLPQRPDDPAHALALHHARQIVSFYEHFTLPDNYAYRDARAAENLRWWRERSGDRIAYWAASAHTADAPELRIAAPPLPDVRFPSAGSYLRRWYGERYRSIGFTFDHGAVRGGPERPVDAPPPAADWFEQPLGAVGAGQFVLDLRAPAPPPVRRWLQAPMRTRGFVERGPDSYMAGGTPVQWFDVVVHRQEVAPVSPA